MSIDKNLLLYDNIPKDDQLFTTFDNILKDLPIEIQIEQNNFKKTAYNLYNFFLQDKLISRIPEPFYSDYVTIYALKVFRQIAKDRMIEELKDVIQPLNV